MTVKTVSRVFVLICVLGSSAAPNLPGQITSVQRDASASANDSSCGESDSDDMQSLAFGTFSAMVAAEISEGSPTCVVGSSSQAAQTSTVTGNLIVASGSSSSGASFASSAAADSTVTATIELTSPTPYTMIGTLSGATNDFFLGETTAGKANIKLTQDTTTIFELRQSTSSSEPFSLTGLLAADTYIFEAVAPSHAIQNLSETAAYDFTFNVPEPSSGWLALLACPCLGYALRKGWNRRRVSE